MTTTTEQRRAPDGKFLLPFPPFMPNDQRTERRDPNPDVDLIRRMASKDPKALEAFYERYKRLAFSLVFRIVGNREDAEDVLVDVFWQVWQQSSRYDASRGKPVAWLLTIARSRAIDRLRSTGRHEVPTSDPDKVNDPPAA